MPFTADQFFAVFAAYNEAIWPAQLAAYALAAVSLAAISYRPAAGFRLALGVLGLFWLWNGAVYHLLFFTRINPAAYGFAALFVVQGFLLLALAIKPSPSAAPLHCTAGAIAGAVLIVYAMALYGILGALSAHAWPRAPVFGVAPCPTVIFTFGVLMLSPRPLPVWLFVIPLVWAAIGSTAAILLSVPEDLGLLAAGLAGTGWLASARFRQ